MIFWGFEITEKFTDTVIKIVGHNVSLLTSFFKFTNCQRMASMSTKAMPCPTTEQENADFTDFLRGLKIPEDFKIDPVTHLAEDQTVSQNLYKELRPFSASLMCESVIVLLHNRLRMYQKDVNFCEKTMWALNRVMEVTRFNGYDADYVVNTMKAHKKHEAIQQIGCQLIHGHYMAKDCQCHVKDQECHCVLFAMRRFPQNYGIQHCGCVVVYGKKYLLDNVIYTETIADVLVNFKDTYAAKIARQFLGYKP